MHISFLIFILGNSSIQVYEKFNVIFQWDKVKTNIHGKQDKHIGDNYRNVQS